jgi:hypothetical protein
MPSATQWLTNYRQTSQILKLGKVFLLGEDSKIPVHLRAVCMLHFIGRPAGTFPLLRVNLHRAV